MRAPSLLLLVALTSCAAHEAAAPAAQPPPPTAPLPPPPPPRGAASAYRFDFVLATKDGNDGNATAFSLGLEEAHKGEVLVGKNVPLVVSTGPGTPPYAPRQDVGQKVQASYEQRGDAVWLDVALEMSTFEAPATVRKIVAKGGALAPPGKQTVVVSLENDQKRYDLSVTPTKLR